MTKSGKQKSNKDNPRKQKWKTNHKKAVERIRNTEHTCFMEGGWFSSPGLHVEVSLGKTVNPKTAPDVLPLHGSHRHQCVNVCMNYC